MIPASFARSPQIELLSRADSAGVAQFLRGNAAATVFHRPEWHELIERTYGHACDYWGVRDGDKISGVFPVTSVRHPVMGAKAVAMPYQFDSGMPLASEPIQMELVRHAVERARSTKAQYLEIRHSAPVPWLETLGFVSQDSGLVTTEVRLPGLHFQQIREGHRRNIRHAERHGVRVTEEPSLEALRRFYRMHLVESRANANPQAGWNFYENLHRMQPAVYRLLLAHTPGGCIGGLLTIESETTVFARYGVSSSPEARKLYVGKALLWRAIADAVQRGHQTFNLGISWHGDAGLIHSKEGWTGTTRRVHVYVLRIRSMPPSPGAYFEGFGLAKTVWRRLPLPLIDPLGRFVTRWVC